MRCRTVASLLLCFGVIALSGSHAGAAQRQKDVILIHFHLFRADPAVVGVAAPGVQILSGESYPAVAGLRSKISSPSELTAATLEALLDILDQPVLDEYFSFEQKWDGRPGAYVQDIKHEAYRFKVRFVPRRLSSRQIDLKLILQQFLGNEARGDEILNHQFRLDYEEPVIAALPGREDMFYLLLFVREYVPPPPSDEAKKKSERLESPITLPKEKSTLLPAYPESLRSSTRGTVVLEVAVTEQGEVAAARVTKALHPYLDFAAVQAIRQWTFVPAEQSGQPVPATISVTVNFDPVLFRMKEEQLEGPVGGPRDEALTRVLAGAADYCDSLAKAALNFICRERIEETEFNFQTDPQWGGIAVTERATAERPGGRILSRHFFPQWDPLRTVKRRFECDYLFVRKEDRIEERRIVLREGRRRLPDRSRILEEKRYTALNPVLAALGIFGRDRQDRCDFRIIGQDRIRGRNCQIVEAIPRTGNTWGVEYARAWIEREGSRIARLEIQGVPIEGYENVLRETMHFTIQPHLVTTHHYEVEKGGLLYPNRAGIRVRYPVGGISMTDSSLKMKIDLTYDEYQFFSVDTATEIKR